MVDFSARINQSACNKLLDSISYPFVAFERRETFPGCGNVSVLEDGEYIRLSNAQVDEMFASCVRRKSKSVRDEQPLDDQLFSFGGSIIQQAKLVLDAVDDPKYEGPNKADLEKIIDGGIQKLGPNLRRMMGDWGLYAWCPYLKITLRRKPSITLRSPVIDLNGIRVRVSATGELYAKFPWLNCSRFCTKWEKVIKCEKVGSVSVTIDIAIEAHATLAASGAMVFATAMFDKLRLDYPILRLLPLEDLVNPFLRNKRILVYDASKLVSTLPVLESRFGIKSINLPTQAQGIAVDVVIMQI